jgi:hypothetical protein
MALALVIRSEEMRGEKGHALIIARAAATITNAVVSHP